jgi:type II secretory pathway component PulF
MALVYPAIVLVAGGATLIFSMMFVVPRFSQIFEDLGSTMPLPTLILIHGSKFMVRYGWILGIFFVIGLIVFLRAIRTDAGRLWWNNMQLKLPLVKRIVSASAFAQFARTLGGLLDNGVPVLQALTIVQNTVGNAVISREINAARDRVTDGTTISAPLAAGRKFPRMLTDMLAVGEESGDMSGALRHIAKRYEDELDRNTKVLTTLLEPLLMILMAIIVGFVAISMLLAVFDLTTGMSV